MKPQRTDSELSFDLVLSFQELLHSDRPRKPILPTGSDDDFIVQSAIRVVFRSYQVARGNGS
jgi:hypothetical protein